MIVKRILARLGAANWSDSVKTDWTPPEGFFTKSADSIVRGLKQHSKDYQQASSRLNFYINRAGDNLSDGDKARLEDAKDKLAKAYGRTESHALVALTREQFDKWPAKRKKEYLEIHPHSTFHNSGGGEDDHVARTTNEGHIHYFTDRSGKEHVYENAGHVEHDLDMLHEQMDKVAKAHVRKPSAAHIKKLNDLHDHAKALQRLATNPKSKKALKFGRANTAHEGLDDPETYIKHHESEYKAPKSAAKNATKPKADAVAEGKDILDRLLNRSTPKPAATPDSNDRVIGESLIDKHNVPEHDKLPDWIKRKYGHIDDPKRMRLRVAQDIEHIPSAVGHVIEYNGKDMVVTDRSDRNGKTTVTATEVDNPDKEWKLKHPIGAKPKQLTFKRLATDKERQGDIGNIPIDTTMGTHDYQPDLTSAQSVKKEMSKIPKWMKTRYSYAKDDKDKLTRIYDHLRSGVMRPGNVINYKGKDYLVTQSTRGSTNTHHKLTRLSDNQPMEMGVRNNQRLNVKFTRFATDDEYNED